MKILVIHASAGAGHQRAAEALSGGLKKYTAHDVLCVDALDFTSGFFKKIYRGTYYFFVSKIPFIWGAIFTLLDQMWLQMILREVRRIYNFFNAQALERFLIHEKFDYVFSTHFMPMEVVSALKRNGKINGRLVTVITDFDVHKIWLSAEADAYAVASPWTKEKLIRLGIGPDKIHVTGIPIDEKFTHQPDIGELKKKLGLKQNIFTVLIATGSFGIGPIEQIIDNLKGLQTVVICGQNEDLYKRLQKKSDGDLKVFGLVNNMHELMAVADCFITKPGGLSISEGLVCHLPFIFFNAIPGQETNNIKVLKHYGIGVAPDNLEGIAEAVIKMRDSKDFFLTAVRKSKELARPLASIDIIKLIK